jgi:hypothetical protein
VNAPTVESLVFEFPDAYTATTFAHYCIMPSRTTYRVVVVEGFEREEDVEVVQELAKSYHGREFSYL